MSSSFSFSFVILVFVYNLCTWVVFVLFVKNFTYQNNNNNNNNNNIICLLPKKLLNTSNTPFKRDSQLLFGGLIWSSC